MSSDYAPIHLCNLIVRLDIKQKMEHLLYSPSGCYSQRQL